jgi:hypothetical protein
MFNNEVTSTVNQIQKDQLLPGMRELSYFPMAAVKGPFAKCKLMNNREAAKTDRIRIN